VLDFAQVRNGHSPEVGEIVHSLATVTRPVPIQDLKSDNRGILSAEGELSHGH
jgi:hypothetical protein